jgi:hypothetical protein
LDGGTVWRGGDCRNLRRPSNLLIWIPMEDAQLVRDIMCRYQHISICRVYLCILSKVKHNDFTLSNFNYPPFFYSYSHTHCHTYSHIRAEHVIFQAADGGIFTPRLGSDRPPCAALPCQSHAGTVTNSPQLFGFKTFLFSHTLFWCMQVSLHLDILTGN